MTIPTDDLPQTAKRELSVRLVVASNEPRRAKRFVEQPLFALLFGFLLTGVLGTWITTLFQQSSEAAKRRAENLASRTETAMGLVDSASATLARGYVLLKRANTTRIAGSPMAIAVHDSNLTVYVDWLAVRDAVESTKLCVYFGPPFQRRYEHLTDSLKNVSQHLTMNAENTSTVAVFLVWFAEASSDFTNDLEVALANSTDIESPGVWRAFVTALQGDRDVPSITQSHCRRPVLPAKATGGAKRAS